MQVCLPHIHFCCSSSSWGKTALRLTTPDEDGIQYSIYNTWHGGLEWQKMRREGNSLFILCSVLLDAATIGSLLATCGSGPRRWALEKEGLEQESRLSWFDSELWGAEREAERGGEERGKKRQRGWERLKESRSDGWPSAGFQTAPSFQYRNTKCYTVDKVLAFEPNFFSIFLVLKCFVILV